MTYVLDLDSIDWGKAIKLPYETKSIRVKGYPSIVQLENVVFIKDDLRPYVYLSDMTIQYDEERSKQVSQESNSEMMVFCCTCWGKGDGAGKSFYLYLPITQLTNKKLHFPMCVDTGGRFCYTYNLSS